MWGESYPGSRRIMVGRAEQVKFYRLLHLFKSRQSTLLVECPYVYYKVCSCMPILNLTPSRWSAMCVYRCFACHIKCVRSCSTFPKAHKWHAVLPPPTSQGCSFVFVAHGCNCDLQVSCYGCATICPHFPRHTCFSPAVFAKGVFNSGKTQLTPFSCTRPSICLLPLFCGERTTDLPLFMAAAGLTWTVLETVRWGIGQTVWSGEKERKMEGGRCNTDTQAGVEKERRAH